MIAKASRRLFAFLLTSVVATGAASAENSDIGPVINPGNGHSYFVTEAQMTWADAEVWAVSLGGHLVAINDAAEDAWMQGNLGLSNGYYWLGAHDDANTIDAVFDWVTGEPFNYQNFLGGEPDDDAGFGGNGDYLALSVAGWGWLDTNGIFVGLVTGAIAEVPAPVGVRPTPAPRAGVRFETRPTVTSDFTQLGFDLTGAASVRCRVFDVRGRFVREVAAGSFGAGPHELIWDTRDDGGRRVRSGVYLVQLQVDGASSTRKVVVTR
ncbi:MAG TPA: FlgD immunoglobulin-like domain containing protein [Candidatus Krumholzibacteria bacterium]|nr:FlgD immunoglobulin-like domain containing protein [Candidatus Krumholzibacteria bacterium]